MTARIYARRNGLYGASCDGTQDTGHHIDAHPGDRFTVKSIKDDETVIAERASRAEAEKAIETDWRTA